MDELKIEIKNLTKSFMGGEGEVKAIENLNLSIKENEFTVLVGPSGCGKSTLLYMLAGFEKPTSGSILLDNQIIKGPGPDRGFVFQDFVLYPWKTVVRNISFGLEIQGFSQKEAIEKAKQKINLLGLQGFENAYPHTLSGGMKQRVGIARALAYNPKVLLMDEPFGSLDAQTRKLMQEELLRIWNKEKKTVVFVTHSVIEAVFLADRVVVLTDRPSRVKGIIDIHLDRPRDYEHTYTDERYIELREKVLNILKDEVIHHKQHYESV